MQLIDPEILTAARGMSAAVCIAGLGVGFLLWLLGWWGHRFWIVLFTTVIAGIVGLSSGRAAGAQPFVAGVLLAITAGVMALALARMMTFVAAGVVTWLLVHRVAPGWDEPLLTFLVGGLLGLLLFRLWTMALTSLAGTLLMAYSGLCLAEQFHRFDAPDIAEHRTVLLNGLCLSVTVLGVGAQFVFERFLIYWARKRKEKQQLERAEKELEERLRRKSRWWPWGDPRGRKRVA
jgi:hypothetical protein